MMDNPLKSNEWQKISFQKTFKFETQKGGLNNWDFLQNWFPPEIRSTFFNLKKIWQNFSWIIQNLLKCNKWQRIWLLENFKIEIQKRGPSYSTVLQNWFLQKLGPHSLICRNFKTLRKVLLNQAECI